MSNALTVFRLFWNESGSLAEIKGRFVVAPEFADGHMLWSEVWVWCGPFGFLLAKTQIDGFRIFRSAERAARFALTV